MSDSKYFLSGCIFILSVSACLLPKVLTRISFIKKIYPFITLFAAGFMLSALLVDFIPEMMVSHRGHSHEGHSHHEDHSHHSHEDHSHHSHEDHSHHSHTHTSSYDEKAPFLIAGISFILLLAIDTIILKHDHCDEKQKKNCEDHAHFEHDTKTVKNDVVIETSSAHGTRSDKSTIHQNEKEEQIGCCNTDTIKYSTSKTQAFIYLLSIDIHSFFEGLAFKSSSKAGSYELGIFIHKILESFAIGITLFSSNFSFSINLLFALFYSALTPLGMIVGSEIGNSASEYTNMLNGLALGSLMFIVCVEMIPASFHRPGKSALKVAILTAGYVLTSFIILKTHTH